MVSFLDVMTVGQTSIYQMASGHFLSFCDIGQGQIILAMNETEWHKTVKANVTFRSDDSDIDEVTADPFGNVIPKNSVAASNNISTINDDDEDDDDSGDIPTVRVGNEEIVVTDVTPEIIAKMTGEEQERYTQIFQDYYSHMYD